MKALAAITLPDLAAVLARIAREGARTERREREVDDERGK
jgi:hypothetical protein